MRFRGDGFCWPGGFIRVLLVKRERREEDGEGKWPLKFTDSPSVIRSSLVFVGGSPVGRVNMSKS